MFSRALEGSRGFSRRLEASPRFSKAFESFGKFWRALDRSGELWKVLKRSEALWRSLSGAVRRTPENGWSALIFVFFGPYVLGGDSYLWVCLRHQ